MRSLDLPGTFANCYLGHQLRRFQLFMYQEKGDTLLNKESIALIMSVMIGFVV